MASISFGVVATGLAAKNAMAGDRGCAYSEYSSSELSHSSDGSYYYTKVRTHHYSCTE